MHRLLLLATLLVPSLLGAQTMAPVPTPAVLGASDLRPLAWIVGSWRGSGETQAPFYERYRFEDDSTLLVDAFADSTMAAVTETTRFALRGGVLANVPTTTATTPAPRWFASALSADSVRFEPWTAVRNTFVWRRGATADEWVAVLSWPARADRPARTTTYVMRRTR